MTIPSALRRLAPAIVLLALLPGGRCLAAPGVSGQAAYLPEIPDVAETPAPQPSAGTAETATATATLPQTGPPPEIVLPLALAGLALGGYAASHAGARRRLRHTLSNLDRQG